MSSEKNEYYIDLKNQYNLKEISEENQMFEMIYKPNDNKEKKYDKSEELEQENKFSEFQLRILSQYFV